MPDRLNLCIAILHPLFYCRLDGWRTRLRIMTNGVSSQRKVDQLHLPIGWTGHAPAGTGRLL
jgi:hypothetical protein